ncbi:MAG: hypothetical protein UV26_C0016G0008 [candidate division WWE3 bacterium GW2011_GWF2_42_42]|uniref:Uncharacterized protein n=1 Tax=candidate division WWE3 bacterium GW2011_GWF2_42_42 TaxID=1619142 RepID=A0A0G1DC66_UNCKA|nr:MAG: hypothetical protein UV26_C0016G0008 [candidate division WWE3 bacterium GW2011_GWF2_42_42]
MKKVLVVFLVIVAVILAYLAGSYRTMELIKQKNYQDAEAELDTCLKMVGETASEVWLKSCESSGSNVKKDEEGNITDCRLPSDLAKTIAERTQTEKDNCFRRYGK